MNPDNLVITVLAAGEGSRMGAVKQLLVYQGKSLLQSAIDKALSTGYPVQVVLGAHVDQIRPQLENLPIIISENPHWQQGIGSSIRYGLAAALQEFPKLQGMAIMLADQPKVTPGHLVKLIAAAVEKPGHIVATGYRGINGVPAFFPSEFFDELSNIKGQIGAKSLLAEYPSKIHSVSFEDAAVDIDTVEDWRELNRSSD